MSWLKKLLPEKARSSSKKRGVPEGVWSKCQACGVVIYTTELVRNLMVCTKCGHHHRMSARERLRTFLDAQERAPWEELTPVLDNVDKLKFKDSKKYKDRLAAAQRATGERDAMIAAKGQLLGSPVVVGAFEFGFIGGSMGAAVGECFVRAAEVALAEQIPLVCFTASGGARMQEGLVSLLQMAKTSAVLSKLSAAGVPYVVVLTDPTMGGVSASLATLGDVILAEPKALVGFAGPRVIAQTVQEILPEGFQRSEFLLEHGAIDAIVERHALRGYVGRLLAKLMNAPLPAVV